MPRMATASASELVSVNPASLEPVGTVQRTDPESVPALVAAARTAQQRWRAIAPDERARVLRAAARIVRAHAD